MTTKVLKIGYWALLGIIVLVIIHFFVFQLSPLEAGLSATNDLPSDMKVSAINELANGNAEGEGGWTDIILIFTSIIGGVAVVYTICMALYQMVKNAIENKESRKGLLVTFIGGLVIIFVSYFAASNTVPFIIGLEDIPEPGTVKLIETGLFITYTVGLLTLLALLYGEISKIWK